MLVNQLSDMQTGIRPVATQQAHLTTSVTNLRLELATVSNAVALGHVTRAVHKHLDQPEGESAQNFCLSAEPTPSTDTSIQWLKLSNLVCSLSGVMLVSFVKPQPGSQVRPCYYTTPIHHVGGFSLFSQFLLFVRVIVLYLQM